MKDRRSKGRTRAWWYANLGLLVTIAAFWNGLIFLSGAADVLFELDSFTPVLVLLVPQLSMLYAISPVIERHLDNQGYKGEVPGAHKTRL